MKKMTAVICGIAAIVAAPETWATPMACKVELSSRSGGRIVLIKTDPVQNLPVNMPLQFAWHPPASNTTVDLVVGYNGNTIRNLGAPSGARAQFTPLSGKLRKDYVVRVTNGDGKSWRFDRNDIDLGEDQADVIFKKRDERGNAVLSAISDGKPLAIEITAGPKVIGKSVFNASATRDRNELVTRAVQMIEMSDPSVCKRM